MINADTDDLSARTDAVKEDNLKLESEKLMPTFEFF